MERDLIGIIRKFRTAQFTVIVDALYDYDTDLSFDESGEVLEKLQSGEYVAFCARARVIHDTLGEVGADYLGGCIYADIAEFQDHRQCAKQTRELRASGSNAVCGSYFADMISTAIKEARATIAGAQSIRVRR